MIGLGAGVGSTSRPRWYTAARARQGKGEWERRRMINPSEFERVRTAVLDAAAALYALVEYARPDLCLPADPPVADRLREFFRAWAGLHVLTADGVFDLLT